MNYDLVFEGGGAKGMVFAGAMEVFESLGHTHGRLLGTSAGAITACLLAAGYSSQEMLNALAEKVAGRSVFSDFMGTPKELDKSAIRTSAIWTLLRSINLPLIPDRLEDKLDEQLAAGLAAQPRLRHILSFIDLGGWYSADSFVAWLQTRLDSGTDNGTLRQYSKLTLAQFYDVTHVDLSVVASDITTAEMLVLNHRTAPDLPLVWAVRMSMSVPLLWQLVVWQAEWGKYRDSEMAGHEIVDGGLISNFPIELYLSGDETVTGVMGPKVHDNVVGLLIDESLPVPGAEAAGNQTEFRIGELPTVHLLSSLLNTILSAHDKMVIDAYEKLVVRLPAKGYGTTQFDMTDEQRSLLVDAGREAMRAYFGSLGPAHVAKTAIAGTRTKRARLAIDKLALRRLRR